MKTNYVVAEAMSQRVWSTRESIPNFMLCLVGPDRVLGRQADRIKKAVPAAGPHQRHETTHAAHQADRPAPEEPPISTISTGSAKTDKSMLASGDETKRDCCRFD
jgi:hypothetical protein